MPELTKLILLGPRLVLAGPRVAARLVMASVSAIAGVPALLSRLGDALTAVETAAARVTEVADAAATVTDRVESTRAAAMEVIDQVNEMQARLADLAGALGPLAERVAGIDPQVAADVARLRDQLRPLVTSMTTGAPTQADALLAKTAPLLGEVRSLMLPLLGEMRGAVPDVRTVLPIADADEDDRSG